MSISTLVVIVTNLLIIARVKLVIISAQTTYVPLKHFSTISKQCSSSGELEVCPNSVPFSQFLPYGHEAGDTLLDPGDDDFTRVNLSITFPFMNHSERVLFININGLISFNQPIVDYKPKCQQLPISQRMVAPYWTDVITNNGLGGQIFFRQSTNPALLNKVREVINSIQLPLKVYYTSTSFKFFSFYSTQVTQGTKILYKLLY